MTYRPSKPLPSSASTCIFCRLCRRRGLANDLPRTNTLVAGSVEVHLASEQLFEALLLSESDVAGSIITAAAAAAAAAVATQAADTATTMAAVAAADLTSRIRRNTACTSCRDSKVSERAEWDPSRTPGRPPCPTMTTTTNLRAPMPGREASDCRLRHHLGGFSSFGQLTDRMWI
jgi:hypothetical protein